VCDGTRDVDDIVDACDGANAEIVSQALRKLSKADLLEVPFEAASGTSRRKMMGQMAGVAGLAAAVTVMVVPTAAMAASGEPCGTACSRQEASSANGGNGSQADPCDPNFPCKRTNTGGSGVFQCSNVAVGLVPPCT